MAVVSLCRETFGLFQKQVQSRLLDLKVDSSGYSFFTSALA